MTFGPRRGVVIDIGEETVAPAGDLQALEILDRFYRALCAVLFNYAPMSGHPGGSISSGRMVAGLLFRGMDYDLANPDRNDADVLIYAAGHKALQVLQGNFPPGTLITLTPWEPREVWPLLAAALKARPAVVAPFVTRPPVPVLDRTALGLAPADAAVSGVYQLRAARGEGDGVVVLQGSSLTCAFVQEALPLLEADGIDLHVYAVVSEELFDRLPAPERDRIFPPSHAARAMGITGFTLPTMYRWVTSPEGRTATLHPFRGGHYLGSGPAAAVLAEAGLDGASQARAIREFLQNSSA